LSTVRILDENSEVKNGDEWKLFVTSSSKMMRSLRIPSWNFRNPSRISDSSQNSKNFEVLRFIAESEICEFL